VHVPFKGGAEAMTEVIAGRIDFFFGPVALVLPQVQSGKLTALAVNGAKRSAAAQRTDHARSWFCQRRVSVLAGNVPAGKDAATSSTSSIARRSRRCRSPRCATKLTALGFEPMVMTPPNSQRTSRGNRHQRGLGQSGRHQGALTPTSRHRVAARECTSGPGTQTGHRPSGSRAIRPWKRLPVAPSRHRPSRARNGGLRLAPLKKDTKMP
jgi:hypothetical protein